MPKWNRQPALRDPQLNASVEWLLYCSWGSLRILSGYVYSMSPGNVNGGLRPQVKGVLSQATLSWFGSGKLWLYNVGSKKDGQGYGRSVMEFADQVTKVIVRQTDARCTIHLVSEPEAVGFYRRLGYRAHPDRKFTKTFHKEDLS